MSRNDYSVELCALINPEKSKRLLKEIAFHLVAVAFEVRFLHIAAAKCNQI